MDDAYLSRTLLICLASLAGLFGAAAGAAAGVEYKYIAPPERRALEEQFLNAPAPPKRGLAEILARPRSCDMFGVRTRMQVKRGAALYAFRAEGGGWANAGEMPVARYVLAGGGLTGESARVRDEVRLTAEGELVSRLTSLAAPGPIVAYSVCRPI